MSRYDTALLIGGRSRSVAVGRLSSRMLNIAQHHTFRCPSYKADLRGARRSPSDACTVPPKLSHSLCAVTCPFGPQPKRECTSRVSLNLNLPWALKKKVCRIKNKQICFVAASFRFVYVIGRGISFHRQPVEGVETAADHKIVTTSVAEEADASRHGTGLLAGVSWMLKGSTSDDKCHVIPRRHSTVPTLPI